MGQMKLRPYQQDAIAAVLNGLRFGMTRQAVVLPTGSGKSLVFSNLPKYLGLRSGQQIWLVVHRQELINQNAKHFRLANPDLKVGIEKAGQQADLDCDIVVASVQSVGTIGSGF